MAAVKEAVKEKDTQAPVVGVDQEALARVSRFFREYESKVGPYMTEFVRGVHTLHSDLVYVINQKAALAAEIHQMEIRRAQIEKEANNRLGNLEQSQRTLVEKMTRKEAELDAKVADAERAKAFAEKKANEYSLLKADLERKLENLAAIGGKK